VDSLLFILRRARRHWELLLTLGLGVLLATALLASGPQLVDTVIELGLALTFQSSSVADANLRLTTTAVVDQTDHEALDTEVRDLLLSKLGERLDRAIWSAGSQGLFPWVDGQLATDRRVNLGAYQGINDHVEYVAGRWPAGTGARPGVIRVVISDPMARSLVLRVGDLLPVSRGQDSVGPDAWLEVSGIARPIDPLDPYWFGEHSPLLPHSTAQGVAQYSAIIPEESFFPAVASLFPGGQTILAWHALLNHRNISASDIGSFHAQLTELDTGLSVFKPRITLETGVPAILAQFQMQLESIRVPIYILITEVMLLALYFVTMVAALYMRQAEREFAILRSRGTAGWQITRIQLAEALVIGTAAFLSGPWLGAGLVKALSWIGPLADLERASWSASPDRSAWLVTGLGALACLACLLLPLGSALRRSIVTHQQAVTRSTMPPWWQRLYLDVFALVGGLILLWRLRLYGEIITAGPGGAQLDWLLLLAPVVLLLGSTTILLRVFPLLLRLVASIAARGPGLERALALWQASRDPAHVTRLVLLLALAIALGNLALGLNTTLDQSEADRATYLAGNDLRLVSQQAIPLVDLREAPGVLELSGVWRGRGSVNLGSAQEQPGFEVLALEPDSFGSVTTYRGDFADQDLGELVSQLAVPEGEHPSLLPLPGQPARFGLWLWGPAEDKGEMDSYQRWIDGDDDAVRVGVMAKLQTAQGELFTVPLHRPETALPVDSVTVQMGIGGRDVGVRIRIRPDNQGWHYFEGALPVLPPSNYPLSLHSLWFENQATRLGEPIPKGVLLVADDLTVVDANSGISQVVEDFDGPAPTGFLDIMDVGSRWVGLFTYRISQVSRSGAYGQLISIGFTHPGHTYPLRLRQTWAREPLPALASPAFMETTKLEAGDLVRASIDSAEIDFRIAGTVRYFPTMYEELEAGYLITSRDLLLALLNDTSRLATNPNEVLLATDGSGSVDTLSSLVPSLETRWQAESVRKALKANPLALGLRAVTFFGFALTILLSLVGFATHFTLTVRQQETLYGVMRALGMSPRQLYAWMVIEQATLIVAGLALGTVLGLLLNQVTLPRLPVSLGDRQPIPPFVPRADWLALGGLYLLLAVALLVMLGIVTALLRRARIHRILRIGQE
jgi:hypothetical protein